MSLAPSLESSAKWGAPSAPKNQLNPEGERVGQGTETAGSKHGGSGCSPEIRH
jgi:hypothetical protein